MRRVSIFPTACDSGEVEAERSDVVRGSGGELLKGTCGIGGLEDEDDELLELDDDDAKKVET